MTCIVGIEHDNTVTIGVDSASSDGLTLAVRSDSKLFRVGSYLLGFTSSYRMGQLLRYKLKIEDPDTWDIDRFMATTFIDAVRSTLKSGGFAKASESVESGGTFMVGIRGRLYTIFDDYQICHVSVGYDSVGSGARVALGSLHTTHGMIDSADIRCKLALEAAADWTTSVCEPFIVESSS